MARLQSLGERWVRFRDALKRELLRDPDVLLFERRPEELANTGHEKAGAL
jgi:Tfp pilus assembly pilus retraction ATPase PilT